ncbi:hypothetical protein OHA70_19975 [Kribbella sp. NBC_00382]|uniref:hypothetical protein n=1 Tax=Kribbella sp. NBC_00382 TaxID=2975967 RepID=UPI002E22A736
MQTAPAQTDPVPAAPAPAPAGAASIVPTPNSGPWPQVTAWSEAASLAADTALRMYAAELRDEAERIASRAKSEVVSPHYVHLASDRVGQHSPSKLADVLMGAGGVVIGAGVGIGGSAWFTTNHGGTTMILVASGITLVGAVALTIGMVLKLVRG